MMKTTNARPTAKPVSPDSPIADVVDAMGTHALWLAERFTCVVEAHAMGHLEAIGAEIESVITETNRVDDDIARWCDARTGMVEVRLAVASRRRELFARAAFGVDQARRLERSLAARRALEGSTSTRTV